MRAIIADVAARGDRRSTTTREASMASTSITRFAGNGTGVSRRGRRCELRSLDALSLARERIEQFHRRRSAERSLHRSLGVELGARWTAIEAVGLYVPGGTAAYPSSVLMNAVPAKVAGVPRIVMVVPAPDGVLPPLVLAAANLAGVDEIYRVGGAQAIAALAYGTATIAPVAKIVGPGNAYVAAAKRIVFGKVGIDMIAGPSEVLILADSTGNADWIAADLLAQAEHDTGAQAILITDDADLAGAVERSVESQLARLPRKEIAAASWRDFGAVFLCQALRTRWHWSMRSPPSILRSRLRMPNVWSRASATPARSSSAHTRRKQSATMSAVRTTCCRRRGRRVFFRARRSRLYEAYVDPQMRAGTVTRARRCGDHTGQCRRP